MIVSNDLYYFFEDAQGSPFWINFYAKMKPSLQKLKFNKNYSCCNFSAQNIVDFKKSASNEKDCVTVEEQTNATYFLVKHNNHLVDKIILLSTNPSDPSKRWIQFLEQYDPSWICNGFKCETKENYQHGKTPIIAGGLVATRINEEKKRIEILVGKQKGFLKNPKNKLFILSKPKRE